MYIPPLGAPAAIGGDSPNVCCGFVPLLPEERHNKVRATWELPKDKINMWDITVHVPTFDHINDFFMAFPHHCNAIHLS